MNSSFITGSSDDDGECGEVQTWRLERWSLMKIDDVARLMANSIP